MLRRNTINFAFVVLVIACLFLAATPVQATLTPRCNWGVGNFAPTLNQWPLSTQVMMMPTVMDFGSPPFTISQVAFVSFANVNDINRDGGGVLRIIDGNCKEIARFPDTSLAPLPIPLFCPTNLNTVADLGVASGLAVGNLDSATVDVEIIGVIGGPTSNHKQIIAFNLVGPLSGARLVPKWCSPPLPGNDFIFGPSAPAIAQLDRPPNAASGQSEIVIDNKVFNFDGTLRFTGFSVGGPRSRTVVVAKLSPPMPQVITGRGVYQSSLPFWTGTAGWLNPAVTNGPLVYPAVADLDSNGTPEIVVVDTVQKTLRVLSLSGTTLASIAIPSPGFSQCGGPPMIGDADGIPGPEIGVAGCNRYSLFKYSLVSGVGTLTPVWPPIPTYDPGGQTTSTLYNTSTGARIYYNDSYNLRIINGVTGVVIQTLSNSSGTAIEGPIVAAFDSGSGRGAVIVAANNYWICCDKGVRIFDDPAIGRAVSYWNEHVYHYTNVTNSYGAIPTVEPLSWLSPARNTYRVQQWP